jgi:hypothetical protein
MHPLHPIHRMNEADWYRLALAVPMFLYAGLTILYLVFQPTDFLNRAIDFGDPRNVQFFMQTLDIDWIKNNFWQCVLYNHYQPPLTSTFLIALLLKLGDAWVVPGYLALNIAASLASFACFLFLLKQIRIHPLWILFTGIIGALYTFRIPQEFTLLYTIFAMFFLTASCWLAYRFITRPSTMRFTLYAAPIIALTLTLSYFHFLWALVSLLIPLLMARNFKKYWVLWLVAASLVLVVPIKNWIIFGNFGSSSCTGIVLAQKVRHPSTYLKTHIQGGRYISKDALAVLKPYDFDNYIDESHTIPDKFKNIECLASPWKNVQASPERDQFTDFNYNYYPVIAVSRSLSKYALQYLWNHPKHFLMQVLQQFVYYFSGTGGLLDPIFPPYFSDRSYINNGFSLRGILYIGSLLICLIQLASRWGKKHTPAYFILIFIVFQIGYGMVMGILVTLYDGTRYRLPFEWLHLLLLANCLDQYVFRGRLSNLRKAA